MRHVVEINDPVELEAYRAAWSGLLAQTRGASFFQSLEWLEAYWRFHGEHQRLRVLLVHDQDRLTGILPLAVRSEPTRLGGMRVLTYPLHDWGAFYGPIGPDLMDTLSAGLAHVRRTPRDWDLLELRWVDESGCDEGKSAQAMAQAGFAPRRQCSARSAQITLSGSWDQFWMARTSHFRNNVRRAEKKLAQRGTIRHVRYRPGGAAHQQSDPRWDLYDACEAIAEESWQSKSPTGTTLTHPGVRLFLRHVHEVAARAGAVDLNLLLLDDVPVAFNYAYHYRGYVFGLRTGYDSAAAAHGAGIVLQKRMIRDCFERCDHTYDLGPDYLECKRYWLTDVRPICRYTWFPPTPRAQLLRLKRGIAGWFSAHQRAGGKTPR